MNKSKKLVFAFFISAALMNGKNLIYNNVHAAGILPNPQSSSYNSNINIFTRYGYKGQCTWFTYGRVLEKLGVPLPSEFYGNAVDWWYANAKDNVYSYGSEPKADSIAVWGGGKYGYGHVGFVEKVEGNTVYLNEGNFSVRGEYDGSVKTLSKEAMKNRGNLYIKGYIYIGQSKASPTYPTPSRGDNSTNGGGETIVKKGVVNISSSSSSLNVRSGANTSFGVVGTLNKGQAVEIVGTVGDWYKIKLDSSYGYVSSRYISVNGASASKDQSSSVQGSNTSNNTIANTNSSKSGYVKLSNNSSSLNLRTSPQGGVITSLANGTKLSIIESNGSWYKVNAGGTTGYVHSSYVSLLETASTSNTGSNNDSVNTSSGRVGTVNLSDASSTLNLRNTPWTGRILSTLPAGSKVEILGTSGRWYKVKAGSTIGYVHSDYIKS